jgi:beta-lactamase superfamily II metal-dependent hydrolase
MTIMTRFYKLFRLFFVLIFINTHFGYLNVNSVYAGVVPSDTTDDYKIFIPLVAKSYSSKPIVGEVVINEFVAANGPIFLTEWVELYNKTSRTLNISGMWIDDIAVGGGSPIEIPESTFIAAGGFYTMTFSSFLNNTGDDVRLLGEDGSTVHDTYSYASATTDMSWCRKPDGESWSPIECNPTFGSTNTPQQLEGTLEIHVLNVGQGDSQLIIGPTGKTLLIDVFEPSWNTNQGATWVASEIRRITGSDHLDYIMASHWHLDHIGYAGYGGIWSLLEQQGITADVLIDRDGGVWDDGNSDGECDPDTEIVWHNAGTTSGTSNNWACWATDPDSTGGGIRELAQVGSSTQIDLGISEGVTATIVQVDADGVMMLDGITPVAGDHTGETTPPSENDYSITIWLKWGKFDYVTGGDTDGEYATSGYGYAYNDVESNVADRIDQEIEVLHVNHHGSSHSTNANYVNTLDPMVAVYSVGSTNTYGHPDQTVLDRLNVIGTQQYFTQEGDPARDYYDSVIVNGNVVITVTQGLTYTVIGDVYVSADPTGSSTPRQPAIGEVVINEFLPAPQTIFTTEWIEVYNSSVDELDIGGMWIDDLIGGGQSPQQIPLGTYLSPYQFYIVEVSSYLNNTGDDVNLLGLDAVTVYDTYTYSSTTYDLSYCRFPDGSTWYSNCTGTKGSTNVH